MENLLELSLDLIPDLRDVFLVDWPQYISSYYTIDNYYNWVKKDSEFEEIIKFLTLDSNWRETGTYIITDKKFIFLGCLEDDNAKKSLKIALTLFDCNELESVYPFRMSLRSTIYEALQSKGLQTFNEGHASLRFLSKTTVINFGYEIPSNLKVKSLQKCHAKIVDDHWPGKSKISLKLVQNLIQFNQSLGFFDENDQLIAWILRREYGTSGMLHVLSSHRKKGYATLLTKIFLKQLAESGEDLSVSIFLDNFVSSKIFDDLGFKRIHEDCRFKVVRINKE